MKNIFISSTFVDMQAERDLVQERVIPALREEARKYGENINAIDLRWGVDTSALETEEGSAKVLKVCLDEIDRSHPYMLIFLGERYGTVMREEQIKHSIFGREDKYTTDDYIKSITALEIEYGALSEKYGELEHCIVCFREPVIAMVEDAEKRRYEEQTEEGKKKLASLKERIKHDFTGKGYVFTYSCEWNQAEHKLTDFMVNGQPLEEVLITCYKDMFSNDWSKYAQISWQEKEQLSFHAIMENKARSFVGREALLEEYYQRIIEGTKPFILQGETGSGKTAIMCKLIEKLKGEGKNVFMFFAGSGSVSSSAESFMRQLIYYLENLLGINRYSEENSQIVQHTGEAILVYKSELFAETIDWRERLEEICSYLPKDEKVYVFIDALERLREDFHVEKLDFFVDRKNIKIVATCTEDFRLPLEAMVSRELKQVPQLDEEEVKQVSRGILESHSRNAYKTIEQEILKKKSKGNPLYISVLIQRLNMMDAKELKKAMNEEEIIALISENVKVMPDELEDAIVAVIQNGIEKISENTEYLTEVICYLAVSKSGLGMRDLQEIFQMLGRELPVLDVTLLLKYLDTFFYIHEDGRIDFSHEIIRNGLLKGIEYRNIFEQVIKEYLKKSHRLTRLRKSDGIYFARICEDIDFAKELICLASESGNEDLVWAIRKDVAASGAQFYCDLIESEQNEQSDVCKFFFWKDIFEEFRDEKAKMDARSAIVKALVDCRERAYNKYKSDVSLQNLMASYFEMGDVLRSLGEIRDALFYYKENLKYAKELYERSNNDENLMTLAMCNDYVGYALMELEEADEALLYLIQHMKHREELHDTYHNENSYRELAIAYSHVGDVWRKLGEYKTAIYYYVKALKAKKELYVEIKSSEGLYGLIIGYRNIGEILLELGKAKKALAFYDVCLEYTEQLYKKPGNKVKLTVLLNSYNKMGIALYSAGNLRDAILYLEKVMRCMEELYQQSQSEASLNNLGISYANIAVVFNELGSKKKAFAYLEKAIKRREELHERVGSKESLISLINVYRYKIDMMEENGESKDSKDSIPVYEKLIVCVEELHERFQNADSQRMLLEYYYELCYKLRIFGELEKAVLYYEKDMKCKENIYEQSKSRMNLRSLAASYKNMGHILADVNRLEEAMLYYERLLKCKIALLEGDVCESLNALLNNNEVTKDVQRNKELLKDVLSYFESDVNFCEELYEKYGGEESLWEVVVGYYKLGYLLYYFMQAKEAVLHLEKALQYSKELLHENMTEQRESLLHDLYEKYSKALSDANPV